MKKKILIVSVRAGAGHLKAAEALEVAFKIYCPDAEIKNIDLLDYSSSLIKFAYGKAYLDLVKALPELYAYSYKHYEPVKNFIKPRFLFDKFNFSDFLKIVGEFNPDVVVTTHFIAGAVVESYKQKNGKNYKIVLTLTDYEFHPLWLVGGVDLFAVATVEVKHTLVYYGVNQEKIIISGIPVDPKFSGFQDKNELRKKYGLHNASPVVLISAGSFGMTPLVQVIHEFKKIPNDFQMIVVCGKNNELKKDLEAKQLNEARLKKVFGFVDFMDKLMAVSDFLITKPGGITVSESIASGLPMMLIEPIPGQEEANAAYLCEQGAAVQARDLPVLIYKFNQLLAEPHKLAQMSENAKTIGRPDAAAKIVERTLKLL